MQKYTLEYYQEQDRIKREKARIYQANRNNKIRTEIVELKEKVKNIPKKCPHCGIDI